MDGMATVGPFWAAQGRLNDLPDKMEVENLVAWRDGRVAEGARLESVYTLTGIGGSNPSLSARFSLSEAR